MGAALVVLAGGCGPPPSPACSATDAGSPDFECAGVAPVSLATLQSSLLTPTCGVTGCHVPTGIAPTDYSSATATFGNVGKASPGYGNGTGIQVVDPGNLVNSTFWLKPLGGSPKYKGASCTNVGGVMPLVANDPLNVPVLDAGQLDLIKGWICGGAPAQ
jgi:hypothetical protein